LIKEDGDVVGVQILFKLLVLLGEEEFAVGAKDSEGRDAFADGDLIFVGDAHVGIHVADIDVDEDVVPGEEITIRRLVEVEVEDVAVAAPVAAEVEDDALVLGGGLPNSGGYVGLGVRGFGVEVLVEDGDGGLESLGGGTHGGSLLGGVGGWFALAGDGGCEEQKKETGYGEARCARALPGDDSASEAGWLHGGDFIPL
jgi:hypothetical protein